MNQPTIPNVMPPCDPLLIEIVERTLDGYRGRLSRELFEHLRHEALLVLANHPYPVSLLQQLTPPPVVQHSTAVSTASQDPSERSTASFRAGRHLLQRGRGGVR